MNVLTRVCRSLLMITGVVLLISFSGLMVIQAPRSVPALTPLAVIFGAALVGLCVLERTARD